MGIDIVLQAAQVMALVAWLGGLVLLGLLAAPVIFHSVESRTLAGRLVGMSLTRLETAKLALAALLLTAGIAQIARAEASPWLVVRYPLMGALALSAAYGALVLGPRSRRLARTVGDFDASAQGNADREAFGRVHKILRMLGSIELLAAGALLYFVTNVF